MARRFLLVLVAVIGLVLLGTRSLGPPPAADHAAFGHGPTIAIVHGLGSNASHWVATARPLARRYRVEMIDLPGHGASSMPEPFSLARATLALDQALGEIGNQPVILVGHSLGGLVAAAEAIEHPTRVRGLVLVETALRPQVDSATRAQLLPELDHDYRALVHGAYLGFGRDSAQGERLFAEVSKLNPEDVRRWIRLAWTADLSREAVGIHAPVLAVLAERSWPKDEPWRVTADALGYTRIPDLKAARLEGCGHFVMLDRPADLAVLIDRFAAGLGATPVASR